jgi:hypothetical protein
LLRYGADGVVIHHKKNMLEPDHHPVCAAKDASRLFLIAHPPLLKEEGNIAPNTTGRGLEPVCPDFHELFIKYTDGLKDS